MKTVASLLSACLLASCATYSEVQLLTPRLELVTTKNPQEFSGCIMPKARERWGSYVTLGPDGPAQVMTVSVEGARVHATLTIAPDRDGSRIAYRSTTNLGKFKAFQDDIAACV